MILFNLSESQPANTHTYFIVASEDIHTMERGTCQCECETFVGPRETDPDRDDPARSTLSIQNSISGEGDRYAYKPLPTPHAFRIMYLLPGSFEDPIQIKLYVCPITSVSRCATLSYEWGTSPLRRNIVCDGKMLEVTTNLYTALKRLRQTDRVGFWWIDAICINQIDNQEKNQQVPLMGEIYKSSLATFAWIGEEPEGNFEMDQVTNTLNQLAATYLEVPQEPEISLFGVVKESHEIPSGEKLKELAQSPSWTGIVDVLLRRSYFTRLWVLQEIALASQVTVVCGRHLWGFNTFFQAARIVWQCRFLTESSVQDVLTNRLSALIAIGDFRHRLKSARRALATPSNLRLTDCIWGNQMFKCTVDRDRVLGVLGLFNLGDHGDFQSGIQDLGSDEQVYMAAARHMLLVDGNAGGSLFRLQNTAPGSRKLKIPSWAPILDKDNMELGLRRLPESLHQVLEHEKPEIADYGDRAVAVFDAYIFDNVSSASENLSEFTIGSFISSSVEKLGPSLAYSTPSVALTAFWQILIAYAPEQEHDLHDCAMEFQNIISSRLGDKDFASIRPDDPDIQIFNNEMAYYLYRFGGFWGRNVFTTGKGYFGIGPMGCNSSGCPKNVAVVQHKDVVAVMGGYRLPVVLRPVGDGSYTYVGNAYVGLLAEAPILKPENFPGFERIRVC